MHGESAPDVRLQQCGDGIAAVLFAVCLAAIHVHHGLPLPADFAHAFGYDLLMMAFWGCAGRWTAVTAFRRFFDAHPSGAARACALLLSFAAGLMVYLSLLRFLVFGDPPPTFGYVMLSAPAPAMIRLACAGS